MHCLTNQLLGSLVAFASRIDSFSGGYEIILATCNLSSLVATWCSGLDLCMQLTSSAENVKNVVNRPVIVLPVAEGKDLLS